jgi:hypothetical protein
LTDFGFHGIIVIQGDEMKTITIVSPTHGTHDVWFDDEDYDLVSQHRWYLHMGVNGRLYARTNIDHPDGGIRIHSPQREKIYKSPKQTSICMHQLINKTPKGMYTDHKVPENTLDNRRSNLRTSTNQQNCANRGINKNNTHGFKGVIYDGRRKITPWTARIGYKEKRIYIGNYKTLEEAARAYDKKAIELNDEFAYLNFPE